MCGLRYVSPLHSSRMRWAAQAQVSTWDGYTQGSGESGRQVQTSLGRVIGSNVRLARGCAPRSLFLHRGATRCSARLDRSGVATRLNDERPPFEGPSRTESHCRWRSIPSPCSRLLSHDLTHVRPPLRLSFTLISNAMRCTGASRHTHNRGTSTTSVLTGQGHGAGGNGRQTQTISQKSGRFRILEDQLRRIRLLVVHPGFL